MQKNVLSGNHKIKSAALVSKNTNYWGTPKKKKTTVKVTAYKKKQQKRTIMRNVENSYSSPTFPIRYPLTIKLCIRTTNPNYFKDLLLR